MVIPFSINYLFFLVFFVWFQYLFACGSYRNLFCAACYQCQCQSPCSVLFHFCSSPNTRNRNSYKCCYFLWTAVLYTLRFLSHSTDANYSVWTGQKTGNGDFAVVILFSVVLISSVHSTLYSACCCWILLIWWFVYLFLITQTHTLIPDQ